MPKELIIGESMLQDGRRVVITDGPGPRVCTITITRPLEEAVEDKRLYDGGGNGGVDVSIEDGEYKIVLVVSYSMLSAIHEASHRTGLAQGKYYWP